MPTLSCRCVITSVSDRTGTSRRHTWIEAADVRALALAATREIASAPEQCGYTVFELVSPRRGVFLEVVCDSTSAMVGPMAGPAPPSGIESETFYPFDELMTALGYARGPRGGLADERTYLVAVRFAGIWTPKRPPQPPGRGDAEAPERYRRRCDADEELRIERARAEGFHLVRHDVPAARWRARDLERLMSLAYHLLPKSEPRWRQTGALVPTGSGGRTPGGRRRCVTWTLEIGRGEYVASLRLPRFPARALADWIRRHPCDINLCYPDDKLEHRQIVRDVESADAAPGPRAPALANNESVHVDSLM